MKFTISHGAFAEALGKVGRAVPNKSTLPVLGNVLLDANGAGSLTATGNNLEMSITHTVKCEVAKPGRTTLPARLLADYVTLLDQKTPILVELDPRTHKVHLECGTYSANIASIDAEDFPPVPDVRGGASLEFPADAFKAAVSAVVDAAAADDSRPVLAGILMKASESSLTLAAADGYRLAVATCTVDSQVPDWQAIVPAKSLKEVARLLTDDDGSKVEVALHVPNALFTFGDTSITTRIIDGQFPDYQRIIPSKSATIVSVKTRELLHAARAAGVFARDNSNIVRLQFSPLSDKETGNPIGEATVRSTSAELGDNLGTVGCTVDGEESQIAFNGRYLQDVLGAIDSENVRIELSGASSPGVFRPEVSDGGGNNTLFVIMPMHVSK